MEQQFVAYKQLSDPARRAILDNFAVIEEAVKRILDVTDEHRERCVCCGCTSYRHFRDYHLAEQLGGFLMKVQRWREEALRLQADEERSAHPDGSRAGRDPDL